MSEFENKFLPEEEPAFPQLNKVVMPKKQKSKTTPRRAKQIKKFIIKSVIVTLITVGALTYGVYKVNEWFNYHTIKFQLPFQTPIWIEDRPEATLRHDVIKEAEASVIDFTGANFITKTDDEANTIQTPDIADVVRKIYHLESSSGKNDGCVTKGLGFNGYGYRQNNREWKCFESREEVAGYVAHQIEKNLETMDLATSLCYYNTGHKINNCDYYQNFLKIK